MNLTKIIEQTGRRIRAGKMPAEKLTNADVKEVLEAAVEVMKEALIVEGRIEIQNFAVIEARKIVLKKTSNLLAQVRYGDSLTLEKRETSAIRIRWFFRPNNKLRNALKKNAIRSKIQPEQ